MGDSLFEGRIKEKHWIFGKKYPGDMTSNCNQWLLMTSNCNQWLLMTINLVTKIVKLITACCSCTPGTSWLLLSGVSSVQGDCCKTTLYNTGWLICTWWTFCTCRSSLGDQRTHTPRFSWFSLPENAQNVSRIFIFWYTIKTSWG